MPGSQKCSSKNFFKIPFSTRLKVLSSFRITKRSGLKTRMASQLSGCGFLGMDQSRGRFDTKMFEMFLKFHEKQFVTRKARSLLLNSTNVHTSFNQWIKVSRNNNKNTGSNLIMFDLILKLHFATPNTGSPSSIQDTMGDYKHNNMLQDHLIIACEQSLPFLRGEGVCTQAICESPSLIVFLSRWDQTTPQMYREG